VYNHEIESETMKSGRLRSRILAADVAWIPLSLAGQQRFSLGYHLRPLDLAPLQFAVFAMGTALGWILLSENLRLDGFRGGWRLSAVISHVLLAVTLLLMGLLAMDNMAGGSLGGVRLGGFSVCLLMGFLGIRAVAWVLVWEAYRSGDVSRVVILGSDRLAAELAMKFSDHPELRCKVAGFLRPAGESPALSPDMPAANLTLSTLQVAELLRRQAVDELVLAHPPASSEIQNLMASCRQHGIRVSLIPQPYELYLSRPQLLDLGGLPLLRLGETPVPAAMRVGKRLFDLGLVLTLGLAAVPVILVCGLALRLSAGRAFCWESRVGQGGSPFLMLRLNLTRDSPNPSRLEWLLAQCSISELPQLWNVLRGQMSLVGPRPEGPERARQYSDWQRQRLKVPPGMTGLAQVRGLRENNSSEDKARLDLQYMLQPSVLKDLCLLMETAWTLAFRWLKVASHSPALSPSGCDRAATWCGPSSTLPLREIFHHAHRTQSGAD
jgi:lipopolysaccharide/colanic/teichoic acid biosynthesis glycosyltransferase